MNDLIDKLLAWRGSGKSGDQAKKRLKLIPSHIYTFLVVFNGPEQL